MAYEAAVGEKSSCQSADRTFAKLYERLVVFTPDLQGKSTPEG
jgi:hypothetical protein